MNKSPTASLMNEFFSKYYNENTRSFKTTTKSIISYVISNHTIDWNDKEGLCEHFADGLYNYMPSLKVKKYTPYTEWYKQEYIARKHFEKFYEGDLEFNELMCPITLEYFDEDDEIVETNCGHIFHKESLEKWNKKHDFPHLHNCPLCRAKNKKWFPFQRNLFFKKEMEMKFCNCISREIDPITKEIKTHRCNRFFLQNKKEKSSVCWCCKWDRYCSNIEKKFMYNTNPQNNDLLIQYPNGEIIDEDEDETEESYESDNSEDSNFGYAVVLEGGQAPPQLAISNITDISVSIQSNDLSLDEEYQQFLDTYPNN